jgi:ribokinase
MPLSADQAGRDLDSFRKVQERLTAPTTYDLDLVSMSAQNVDRIHTVERVAADHEVRIGRPAVCPGGSGANTSCALARLGRRVATIGIVGHDDDGALVRQSFAEAGVDQELLLTGPQTEQLATGRTLVFTDSNGKRSIYVYPGVNEILADYIFAKGSRSAIARKLRTSRVVHFSSFTGEREFRFQESLVEELSDLTVLSFTPGALYSAMGADRLHVILERANILALYEQQLDSLLRNSSIGLDSERESLQARLESFFGWKARRQSLQPMIVVVKSPAPDLPPAGPDLAPGAAPEYLSIASGTTALEDLVPTRGRLDRHTLQDCVDATGAGDALMAGVLVGLLEGMEPDICADLAFTMAHAASRGVGARTTLPNREELDRLLDDWFGAPQRP